MSDPKTMTIQQVVDQFLAEEELPLSPASRCPYLPARDDRVEYFFTEELSPPIYEALMNRGFRRNGCLIYRPACHRCRECKQIRIPVADFKPTRSMRRVWRCNHDVSVESGPPEPTPEKLELFRRYLETRHDGTMTGSQEEFHEFLYSSPVSTWEFRYYLGRRLVGVSLVDRGPRSLSSVYMFFDPGHHRRSPGTFSILWEIEHCRSSAITYYYLGYYIANCRTMTYKARYQPCEILQNRHNWIRLSE
ncbi:MAG: arginyltransferase [Phycisphaerae bacterium]|nr:arginyltransferase [Phycisphaerae bacterium]